MKFHITVVYATDKRFGIWKEKEMSVEVDHVLSISVTVLKQLQQDHPETTAMRLVSCRRAE